MKTEEGERIAKEEKETPTRKKLYPHKFQDKWLRDKRFSPWLSRCCDNDRDAFCIVCHRKIAGSVTMIERHRRTKKHVNKCLKMGIIQVNSEGKLSSFDENKERNDNSVEEVLDYISVNEDEEVINTTVEDKEQLYNQTFLPSSTNGRCRQGSVVIKDRHMDCLNLFQQLASTLQQEDEFDHFAKSIASQLRKLPEQLAVSLISEVQNLVTTKRLKHLNDRQVQQNSIPASQVITVSYENPHFNT